MNKLKTNNVLHICILAGIFICLSCELNKKNVDVSRDTDRAISKTEDVSHATVYSNGSIDTGSIQNVDQVEGGDIANLNGQLEVNFDSFYQNLHLFSLPISINTDVFIEAPTSIKTGIFDSFNYARDSIVGYDNILIAKLPEYKDIKVFIVYAGYDNGSDDLSLYTSQNYKLIDKLLIQELSDNYENDVVSKRSFSITNNYTITVMDELRWTSPNMDSIETIVNGIKYVLRNDGKSVLMEQTTYIITDDGKFQKKQ